MKLRQVWMALALLALPLVGFAGEREEAELERLTEDLQRFSDRQIWDGVERRYEQILALEGVKIPREVHLQAAHAARSRGDMLATLERLERAEAIESDEEVLGWITEITEIYGRVELMTVPARSVEMTAEVMPFAPDQRKVVEIAITELSDEGVFIGMLPAGKYRLAGKEFEVIPGVSTKVELSAKELRAEKKRQEDEAGQ